MNKNLPVALKENEKILCSIDCFLSLMWYFPVMNPTGTLFITNQRLLYYGDSPLTGEFIQEFDLNKIDKVNKKKGLFSYIGLYNPILTFLYEGYWYRVSQIYSPEEKIEEFLKVLKEQLSKHK